MGDVKHIDIAVWVDDAGKIHASVNGDEVGDGCEQSDYIEFNENVMNVVGNAVYDTIYDNVDDGAGDDFCKSCML